MNGTVLASSQQRIKDQPDDPAKSAPGEEASMNLESSLVPVRQGRWNSARRTAVVSMAVVVFDGGLALGTMGSRAAIFWVAAMILALPCQWQDSVMLTRRKRSVYDRETQSRLKDDPPNATIAIAGLRSMLLLASIWCWAARSWTIPMFVYLAIWFITHIALKEEFKEYRDSDSFLRRWLEDAVRGIFRRNPRKWVKRYMPVFVGLEAALVLSLILAQPGLGVERKNVHHFAEHPPSLYRILGGSSSTAPTSIPSTTLPPTTTKIHPGQGTATWYGDVCPYPTPAVPAPGEPGWAKQEIYEQYLGAGAPGGGTTGGCAGMPQFAASEGRVTWYAIGHWQGVINSVAIAWHGGPGAIYLTPAAGPALRFLEDGIPITGVERSNVLNGDIQFIDTTQGTWALVRPTKHTTGQVQATTPYLLLAPSQLSLWMSYMTASGEWVWPVRSADGNREDITLVTSSPYGVPAAQITPSGSGGHLMRSSVLTSSAAPSQPIVTMTELLGAPGR
jgi:hypothetical protein